MLVPCILVLFLLICSLPDVAPPPPRMVLFGALAQVLLLPLGIVASGDGLVALPLCGECCGALSPLFIVSHGNKGLWPCVGIFSLYTMLPVLLGCCVLPH